jgi:hypothetical protein
MLMVSTVVILTVLSAVAVMAYANGTTNDTNAALDAMYDYGGHCNGTLPFFGRHEHGHERGYGAIGPIIVSEEYKDNVISIAQNDSDVQELLADGYNVTDVRPIITTTVEVDGTVTMKATTAIITLSQNTTGRAYVTVNVEEAKVTEIVILTRTIIERG